jgi:hypothetical protein
MSNVRRHKLRLCQLPPGALLLLLCAANAAAQGKITVSPSPLPLLAPPYVQIEFVSEGEPYGPVSQEVRGRFHRLVVLRAAIAYQRPVLRIETLTYGDEGCCSRLIGARLLPIEQLGEQGLELPEATASEFKFVRWLGTRAFEFKYGNLICKLSGAGKSQSVVACKR